MKIGFVGTGHMGGSIALALHNSGHELLLHNRTEAKAQALCGRLGACAKVATLGEAVDCDYVFVGVKPKDVEGLLQDPAWATCPGVIVSMVAGLPIAKLQGYLPAKPLIRILPNTPVAVGQGLTLAVYGEGVSEAKRAEFAALYVPTGKLAIVKEDELDSASVLTGSAPAYLDYFVDALIQAGVALGLDPAAAKEYVLGMCQGTIALCLASQQSPLELGKAVCSPGGSTIEGVEQLLQGGLYDMVRKAAFATDRKNRNMLE